MTKEHVLQVNIDNNGGNGAFALVQSLYELLKDKYIFDYYTMGTFVDSPVLQEIIKNGGKCENANLRKNKLLGHMLLPYRFYRFLKENKYNIVHIHSEVAYKHFLYCLAARKASVEKIIIHSHSSSIDGTCKGVKYICHMIFKGYINEKADYFLACSEPAANWMFKDKVIEGNKYCLLNNGIIPNNFKYDEIKRNEVRKKMGINGKKVIGHVGAFKWVKNQSLLIEILAVLKDEDYILFLVGDGEDKDIIEKKAKKLGVIGKVIFAGNRSDVNELLLAMDIFVFPSFFEGIPISLIEAQCIGVPVIASDSINHEVKLNNNFQFYSLDNEPQKWAEQIEKKIDNHIKEQGYINVSNSRYNINESAEKLRIIYEADK